VFYDTVVIDAPMLWHLVNNFGGTQMPIGSDGPFNFRDLHPGQRIEEAGFDEGLAMQLIRHDAKRFLGLPRRASA
jgi:aminocarboxymuconate-semialdehyde decarboxylase